MNSARQVKHTPVNACVKWKVFAIPFAENFFVTLTFSSPCLKFLIGWRKQWRQTERDSPKASHQPHVEEEVQTLSWHVWTASRFRQRREQPRDGNSETDHQPGETSLHHRLRHLETWTKVRDLQEPLCSMHSLCVSYRPGSQHQPIRAHIILQWAIYYENSKSIFVTNPDLKSWEWPLHKATPSF